jgi:predicted permease
VIALSAVAIAANAIVFAAADAFVFRPVPYLRPETLAVIERHTRGVTDYISPNELAEWRRQQDVFAAVEAHLRSAAVYVTADDRTEAIPGALVTPGLFELLGVVPEWGRPLVQADAVPDAEPVVILSEGLARRMFVSPERAIDQTITVASSTARVVGVMPASFRFPTAREAVWRPLDLSPLSARVGVRNVVRLAAGQTIQTARISVMERGPSVVRAAGLDWEADFSLAALGEARRNPTAVAVFAMLLGAATCLLLVACANVTSLELAAATGRARDQAVHAALGASRGALAITTLLEGLLLLAASAATAWLLARWGVTVLDRQLTASMRDALVNPLDIDPRSLAFMVSIAGVTWLLSVWPAVWSASRLSVVESLRNDPRVLPVWRASTRVRQWLMTGQIALTVLLLIGALLFVRSYLSLVGRAKGFDAARIATIELLRIPDAEGTPADTERDVLDRLRATPGVVAASRTDSLPPSTQSGGNAWLEIDDAPRTDERVMIHFADVDPDYFETMGIQLVEGRPFTRTDALGDVVIDERLARKYWPGRSPLGSSFSLADILIGGASRFRVIGVARMIRADRVETELGEQVYVTYIALSPRRHPLAFVARLDDPRRLSVVEGSVRAAAGRAVVRIDTIEARYERLDADSRLIAVVTTGFGLATLLVATSGVYAVMAFLVATRRREIAIRMALGADYATVRNLVFSAVLRFVVVGAAIGIVAALSSSRWIGARLFGVVATDAETYGVVVLTVAAAAMVATWWPTRCAARIDPATALRRD